MLDLPWTTEANLPYGEQPRIYDATGALVAVVGNAEIDKQDDWERNATAIINAVNSLSTITPAEVGGLVERLRDMRVSTAMEAASLIQSQAARIAELEAGLLVARKWIPVGHRNGLTATENMERDAVDALLNGERKGVSDITPHDLAMAALRRRCKELHQQLGRNAMLRQGDPVETLFAFAKSLVSDREYVIGFNDGWEEHEYQAKHGAPSHD